MKNQKTLTCRSNKKTHKEWFASSTKEHGCFFIHADYSYTGKCWTFRAFAYREHGGRVSFRDKKVDGVAVGNLELKCELTDKDVLLAMANKVAEAVIAQSVLVKSKALK